MERKHYGKFLALPLVVAAMQVEADTIRYYLDQSNALPSGVNYAQVTISDSETTVGDIDFSVELLTSAFSATGSNFGMQEFAFNVDDSLSIDASNIVNLSATGWKVSADRNAGGGYGKFDFQLSGTGRTRSETITFSISGVAGDTVHSYGTGSALNPGADEFFSTHIAGFEYTGAVTSAKFAGSMSVVPVPPALWLFASGILALGALLRRRA